MKIVLEYNPANGELVNPKDGVLIATWLGLNYIEAEKQNGLSAKVSVSELKDLKEAGYTAHEIAELRASGVL